MSLGILGGTFNPPHRGHIAVAGCARAQLALERVLLMPAHTPPHKLPREDPGADPGAEHRLRMCRLAAAEADGLAACGLEVERGGTSYTVDTLETIHAKHPEARLTFIVGADTARTLGSWREPERLLELAELAVATRAGSPREEVLDALAALTPALSLPPSPASQPGRDREAARSAARTGAQARVRFLAMPAIAVSSSTVRERIARGEPIEPLVGPAVAAYIAEHRLYAARIGAAS